MVRRSAQAHKVFVDTQYLLARTYPSDPWHRFASEADRKLRPNIVSVTTYEVLTEFLAGSAGLGPYLRQQAIVTVRQVLNDDRFIVIPQSYTLFQRGLERYSRRLDKSYSLVDCISMVVMEDEGITDVLTNDHHFEQEGFVVLIRRS
jgi:uncharacterized protein